MRTEEDELDFAKACMVIEKQGGDVLAYIAKEYPSYTPRPVWYRLQRDYLKRKPFQITEGRPKKKGTNCMRKARGSIEESAAALVACMKSGNNPRECLEDLGYTNLNTALSNIRKYARENRPEWSETLAEVRLGGPSGRPRKTPKPEETDTEPKHRPVTTCCIPDNRKGVEVPDEITVAPSLQIAAVRSDVCDGYKYERVFGIGNQDNVALVWRDPVCRGENSLIFSVNNWLQIAKEIPQMLNQLGLI